MRVWSLLFLFAGILQIVLVYGVEYAVLLQSDKEDCSSPYNVIEAYVTSTCFPFGTGNTHAKYECNTTHVVEFLYNTGSDCQLGAQVFQTVHKRDECINKTKWICVSELPDLNGTSATFYYSDTSCDGNIYSVRAYAENKCFQSSSGTYMKYVCEENTIKHYACNDSPICECNELELLTGCLNNRMNLCFPKPPEPPTDPPEDPPEDPPTDSPEDPPTDPPEDPPTDPPEDPPTDPPEDPPEDPPVEPPSTSSPPSKAPSSFQFPPHPCALPGMDTMCDYLEDIWETAFTLEPNGYYEFPSKSLISFLEGFYLSTGSRVMFGSFSHVYFANTVNLVNNALITVKEGSNITVEGDLIMDSSSSFVMTGNTPSVITVTGKLIMAETSKLTIQPGGSAIYLSSNSRIQSYGDFTAGGTLEMEVTDRQSESDSIIAVDGCVDLSEANLELKIISRPPDNSQVNIAKYECRASEEIGDIKVEEDTTCSATQATPTYTDTQLSVLFSVDNSKCTAIIAGSAAAGFVVIVVVVVVVIILVRKRTRKQQLQSAKRALSMHTSL